MPQQPFTRRGFLAGAAAGWVLARGWGWAAGQEPNAPADRSAPVLRWGVIGTGTRGGLTHVPVLKSAPSSELIALCDVSEQRLSSAAERWGKPVARYTDYQKLLANPDINAVVISTPNLLHREHLLAALQAGKHVLCEKPFGVTPADAAAMTHAAQSANTVVMFGMQYRHNPRQRKVRELITAGRIGQPKYIVQNVSRGDWNMSPNVWQYSDPAVNGGKPGNWRLSHAATGGTLNEFDCHYFDLLNWLAGAEPQRVSCDGGIAVYNNGRNTWDHATVTLSYPNGITAVHTLCLFGPGRNDLRVFGDEGMIESGENRLLVSNPGHGGAHRTGPRSQEVEVDEPAHSRSADDATLALYEDFLTCVKTGKKPDANADRALVASKTCWLAELSCGRRAEVAWDALPA